MPKLPSPAHAGLRPVAARGFVEADVDVPRRRPPPWSERIRAGLERAVPRGTNAIGGRPAS